MSVKLPYCATFFTLCGLVILCLLGAWQIQRLQWKQEILIAIEEEMAVDASARPIVEADFQADSEFKRGFITGRYDHEKELFIQSRTHEGISGYHVIVPMTLDAGGVILVNRGWVPIERERKEGFVLSEPSDALKASGVLRAKPSYSSFVPENQPSNDMWYKIDVPQIAAHFSLQGLKAKIFYVENESRDEMEIYPISAAEKLLPNNNHAQYAGFWFAMAAALLMVYVLRFIMPQLKA